MSLPPHISRVVDAEMAKAKPQNETGGWRVYVDGGRRDTGEGPFSSQEAAVEFADSECGVPWTVRQEGSRPSVDDPHGDLRGIARGPNLTVATPLMAYIVRYEETPGGPLHEASDIYDAEQAENVAKLELLKAQPGTFMGPRGAQAVIWRAPYDEETSWRSWPWERWEAFQATGKGPRRQVLQWVEIPKQADLDH